jgi:hypothetical protein
VAADHGADAAAAAPTNGGASAVVLAATVAATDVPHEVIVDAEVVVTE